MAADWSILPSDPLGAIAMKLKTYEDVVHFSVVCRWWNCVWSLIKHQWRVELPSLLLAENTKENPNCFRKIFNLNNNQFYQLNLHETFGKRCWGSAYGWVAMADTKRNVELFNPITKARIHNFPSFRTLEHYRAPEDDFDDDLVYLRCFLVKLIVLRVPRNDHHEFVIMVIYDHHTNLAFAREGDQSWTSVSIKKKIWDPTRRLVTKIVDVVTKDNHIFALYGDGAIVHWNVREFQSNKLLKPMDYSPPGTVEMFSRFSPCQLTIYLVESHGDLMMLVRYKEEILDKNYFPQLRYDYDIIYRTKAFEVFKLNEDNKWGKIDDLGNVALFVGANYSMSISLGVAQSLQHSCIFFTDDEYEYWSSVRNFGGHDMGFYDMK